MSIVLAYNWETRNTGNRVQKFILPYKSREKMQIREGRDGRREGRLVESAIRMLGVLGLVEGRDGENIWNSKFCGNEC